MNAATQPKDTSNNANVTNIDGSQWDGEPPISDAELKKRKEELNLPDLRTMTKGKIEVSNLFYVFFWFSTMVICANSGFGQMMVGYYSAYGEPFQQINTIFMYGFQASFLIVGYLAGLKFPPKGRFLGFICIMVGLVGGFISFMSDIALLYFNQNGSVGNPILIYFQSTSADPEATQMSYNKLVAFGQLIIVALLAYIGGGLSSPMSRKLEINRILARSKAIQSAEFEITKAIIDEDLTKYKKNAQLYKDKNDTKKQAILDVMESDNLFNAKLNAISEKKNRAPLKGFLGKLGFTKQVRNVATKKEKDRLKKA